ncbi:hypothetical protein BBD41_06880 [Paenibacillus ihbetae]|uniref:Uncharacterized protein n=1 Tax=Paenibacillus ihbetae TaxID=1870820 RepID=A0A1B2DX74_9BACL|nr:hypothetical protein [Paenibacillus ihbetae]ANY72338.1 hypothetical protein BBD41_06880 [Paenibacillus ihbetae]
MTRDWQEDKNNCHSFDEDSNSAALKYWLERAALEKQRADTLDAAVKEAIEICERMTDSDDPLEILEQALIKLQLVVSLPLNKGSLNNTSSWSFGETSFKKESL